MGPPLLSGPTSAAKKGPPLTSSATPEQAALPVFKCRGNIVKTVLEHQVTLIIGETGCGKTTQIPQFLLRSGRFKGIVITQPRRVATMTLAHRVASELQTNLGQLVGYKVRFDQHVSAHTKITFMTDGTLLRELSSDVNLSKFDVVIMDEVHERTLRSDACMGLMKDLVKRQPSIKVVVMSATLDEKTFSEFWERAPILRIPGRTFPVRIFHSVKAELDYRNSVLAMVAKIHFEQPKGDILVFLTGQEEIDAAVEELKKFAKDLKETMSDQGLEAMKVLPLYANLPQLQQLEAFRPADPGVRKVVLSTNIAETSVTVPGVRYVVDAGYTKVRTVVPRLGLEQLSVKRISKASAQQRSGRAGREAPGKCWRLYTDVELDKWSETNVPEILRCGLAGVVLELKSLGVHDAMEGFPYVTKPSHDGLKAAHDELVELGALSTDLTITPLGRSMVRYPLEPRFAKVLCKARASNCVEPVIRLLALLSNDSIFLTPTDESDREAVYNLRQSFYSPHGDLITYLNVFHEYQSLKRKKERRDWCHRRYINLTGMLQATRIMHQLRRLAGMPDEAKRGKHEGCSPGPEVPFDGGYSDHTGMEPVILKCFMNGFKRNMATLQKDRTYLTSHGKQTTSIHPASVLFRQKIPLVMYVDLVYTNRHYMRCVSVVEPSWVQEVARERDEV